MSGQAADPRQPRVFGTDLPKTLFLLRHRFQQPPGAFEAAYAGHRAYVERNVSEGRFLAAGPSVPWDGGCILARGVDKAELEAVVATDPLVGLGITAYEITEWKTTIRAQAFDALFT